MATWFFLLESGVHATLAGVALGLMTPTRPLFSSDEFDNKARRILDAYPARATTQTAREHVDYEARQLTAISHESIAPLSRLEHRLHLWSSFAIVPIFALANAGVRISDAEVGQPVAVAIFAGLVIGKPIGVLTFSGVAAGLRLATRPHDLRWSLLAAGSLLTGIGFTMSLFIAGLAYPPALLDAAKIGILTASVVSAAAGPLMLIWLTSSKRTA